MSKENKSKLVKTSRKCNTKLFSYEDQYGLINDNATIVFGSYTCREDGSLINEINDAVGNILGSINDMYYPLDVKGIAKLDPADKYDSEKGLAIASSRAEIAGLNWSTKSIKETKEKINKLIVLLDRELSTLEKHKATLKERVKKLSE